METKLYVIDENKIDETKITEAGNVIKSGGLVAFPTETVYGLGGDALNPQSSQKIYEAKGRPSDNPLIVHICRWEDIKILIASGEKYEEIYLQAKKLADAFWPGPLTMVLPKSEKVPLETTGGLQTVAVRMPSHKTALSFIEAAGGYVAAPSANLSGKPSPTMAKYVAEDMNGRIDMILDSGAACIGLESTIVDLTEGKPIILRPGYITKKMLQDVLGEIDSDVTMFSVDSGQVPKAPGMKYRHYAPKGELTIVSGEEKKVCTYINRQLKYESVYGRKTGVIATDDTCDFYQADIVKSVGNRKDEAAIANSLYRILREFDDEEVEIIFSEAFETGGMGQAIMNRLLKAAGHHVEYV